MPFVPTGYLKHSEAINRVAEIKNVRDPTPPLTEEERDILQGVRDRVERAKRPPLREVTPIHSLSTNKPFVSGRARKGVEAELPPPPRPKISREEFRKLVAKEARIKEQHHVAGQVLRQLLYAGRVPSKTIKENGLCIETPKRIWGGKQWDEALRRNWVVFPGAYGLSVSGQPIILLDALEAAFDPDGTEKEEPSDDATARDDQLQQAAELPDKRPRTRDAETEALFRNRIEGVLAKVKAKWPDPQKRPGVNQMARLLVAEQPESKVKGFGEEAIRKILPGTYKPMKNSGIPGLSSR